MSDVVVRHSVAAPAAIISDPDERAKREASNGLIQDERVRQYVLQVMDGRPFKLRPSILLDLNRCAIDGLDVFAGNWRPGPVEISDSKHAPPEACTVPSYVEELCDYINDNWNTSKALHLAAMTMWRLNWIHPFTDGNGRTARAASYLVLCAHQARLLPGTPTIPEQIVAARAPYYEALEKADDAYVKNGANLASSVVSEAENMMGTMLARQLAEAFREAGGDVPTK